MDRNALKVRALRDSISALVLEYEDKIAELRVDLTLQGSELEDAKMQIDSLQTVIIDYQQKENERNVPQGQDTPPAPTAENA
jgi:hypothetical protein